MSGWFRSKFDARKVLSWDKKHIIEEGFRRGHRIFHPDYPAQIEITVMRCFYHTTAIPPNLVNSSNFRPLSLSLFFLDCRKQPIFFFVQSPTGRKGVDCPTAELLNILYFFKTSLACSRFFLSIVGAFTVLEIMLYQWMVQKITSVYLSCFL